MAENSGGNAMGLGGGEGIQFGVIFYDLRCNKLLPW